MARAGRVKEDAFNQKLGEVIERIRTDWSRKIYTEETGNMVNSKLRPDMLIAPDNLNPVTIESAYEDTQNVDQDAIDRLGERVKVAARLPVLTSIVLAVPAKIRSMKSREIETWLLAEKGKFKYAAYSKDPETKNTEFNDRYPREGGYLEGDVWDLISFVELSSTPDSSIKRVAKDATQAVFTVAERLGEDLENAEIRAIKKVVGQPKKENATKVAACIWLNALILHARMSESKYCIPGHQNPILSPWKIDDIPRLLSEWDLIMTANHKSVFEPARSSLEVVSKMDKRSIPPRILRMLKDAVDEICKLRIGPVGDIGAQIFPELADDRNETAAYYTIPASAELLAGISIPKLGGDKRYYKIGDFASGTGTLLKAAYRAIIRGKKFADQEDPRKRHKGYMENCLFGADIQPLAANLTCAGLAGIFPDVPFKKDNIACAPVTHGRAGSLELFDSAQLSHLLEKDRWGEYDGESRFHVYDSSLDAVIMNPPYFVGGSSGLAFNHSGLKEADRIASKETAAKLFKKGRIKASRSAGLGLSFASLADKKLKEGEGIFSFVLPMTAASSSSWTGFRKHMTDYYTDLMVISCDQSFSESTSINEILIRGKKASNADFRPKQMFMVTLKRRPKDFVEAHVLSKSILDLEESGKELGDILIGEEKMGSFYVSRQSDGKPWPASGHGVEIKKIAEKLASGYMLPPRMTKETPIEDVKPLVNHENLAVGPTHDLIGYPEGTKARGAFLFKKASPGDKLNLSMWRTDSHNQNSVFCNPTHRGIPRSGMEDEADRMLETKRSTLFLSRCFGMASQPLLASMTREKCLGGRAHTALICGPEIAPVYWMWFNSIFGMAIHWHQGSKTQVGRISMGIRDIEKVPCPDFSKNTAKYSRMRKIASTFVDNFGDKTLMPAAFAWIDPVRHEIDKAVMEMLEVGSPFKEEIQSVREMWCRERSVHRGALEVVRKLEESNLFAA